MSTAAMAVQGGENLAGAPKHKHLENTTTCLPIVHGSIAWYLGKKADEFQTHQWTLYLRGPNNEDLSVCIKKVVFHLHASFAQPTREFTEPPYEVTEKGWGEFEAQIRIIWKDSTEKPTVLTHGIKLYPPGAPANVTPTNTETPVVAETYDEVVFTDPHESFFKVLQGVGEAPTLEAEYSQSKHFKRFSDEDDATTLLEAQRFLTEQTRLAKERLKIVDKELLKVEDEMRAQIADHQQKKQKEAVAAATAATATQGGVKNKATTTPRGSGATTKKAKTK